MGNSASPQMLQQGLSLFDDVAGLLGGQYGGKVVSNAEDRADLIEADAEGDARDLRRQAGLDAAELKEERERSRSMDNARWGGSGLAMSGSKALIRDADRLKDRQDEEDVLFQGEQEARSRLRNARSRANGLRGSNDVSPLRSTLSLGSKIYGRSR